MQMWHSRTAREKILMVAGAVVVVIVALYALVLSPISNEIEQARNNYQDQQTTYVWMQHAVSKIEAAVSAGMKLTRTMAIRRQF